MWRPIRNLTLALLVALAATPAVAQTPADNLAARTAETLYRLAHLFEPPAQSITIPNTFVNGTVADATQVNANFTALSSNALNRNGGTMLGTLNSRALTPTSDATYDAGTNVLRFRDGWFSRNGSFAGTLAVTGAVTFTTPLGVAGGGTGLASGTSGGIPCFTAGTTIASSGAFTANALVVGGGAGVCPGTLAGTSGGVPYFNGANTAASSAALTAHGVVIGGGAGTAPTSTTAGTSSQVLTSNGASADPTFQSSATLGAMVLLCANSGASASTVAVNLDTCAISGLTAKDSLYVVAKLSCTAQPCSEVMLYSSTDAGRLVSLAGNSSFNANTYTVQKAVIGQDQAGATTYDGGSEGTYSGTGAFMGHVLQFAAGTNYTGTWTLALRLAAGSTAGLSLKWTWAVYKFVGQ